TYARLNGTEDVSLSVRKRAGENLLQIAADVKQAVNDARSTLPAGISLTISNDQSDQIQRSVHELENSIMTGMFLVVLALFMFFGFKNSLLVSTAIPLAMFIGFLVLGAFDITLNFVVLFSLVLVLGILVDDAIVVIENIYRHQHEYRKSPADAAKDATAEVAVPVTSSTITTVAPFIPLLFWPGVVGDFMWYLPITLIVTLGASLFVAFVISPVQGAQWINYQRDLLKTKKNLGQSSWWKKYNPFAFLYHEVDQNVFPWMQQQYVTTLRWTLQRRGVTIAASVAFLVLVFVLFGLFGTGVEFFPEVDPQQINVSIEAPAGTSLDVTNTIAAALEERLKHVNGRRDMEFVVTSIGTSDDPFDFGGGQGTSNKGRVSINFLKKADRSQSSVETMEGVRSRTVDVTGADIRVSKLEMGPPVGAPVSIEISGDDYAELARLSARIREQIGGIPNLVDLKDDYNVGKPEIEVVVDREKAGLLWTNTGQIASTVRAAINGAEASKYRVGEDEYKIRVRLREDQRTSPADLENVHVTFMNRRGTLMSIPLTAVADIRHTAGVTDIRRKDLKRVITITGNVEGRLAGDVLDDIRSTLTSFEMPQGYSLKFTGKDEEQKKAEAFLSKAFIITILMVFLILVIEFNSVKVPFVIMLSVMLSLIGVMIG
ncbi:MAG: efflux RND transporter permease subunit, partial [Bacteroidota bacterium]